MSATATLDARVGALCGDPRRIRAPRGNELNARSWSTEAPLRMLLNNLDPDVAERPEELVVYGGSGKAARNRDALHAIVRALLELGDDETLLVQSGKPVGVFRTHALAPRVLIANSLLVPRWATWDEFRRLEAAGLTMFGQMTAGSCLWRRRWRVPPSCASRSIRLESSGACRRVIWTRLRTRSTMPSRA